MRRWHPSPLVTRGALRTILLLLLVVRPASAQEAPLGGLDDYITRAMAEWRVPGLAIAVVRGDSVMYARGFGVREHGRSEPVDEHTLFAIASTTKAFTAAALGILVDEGRVEWDDPVARHLPALRLSDPWVSQTLTVRDLLTHRSGISRSDNLWIAAPFSRTEVLRRARFLPAVEPFRSTYGYHNVMYIAAGEVVGAAAGTTWDDFVTERIFAPLGMTRSTTRAAVVESRDNVAIAHVLENGRVTTMARRNYDNIGGAGAAWSSARDMAQWIRLHLNGGSLDGRRIISEATVRELHSPQVVIRSDTAFERQFPHTHLRAYGLGWIVQDYHGRKLVQHSGSINFTRTQVGMLPAERIGVVIITNLASSNLQTALMYRVLDELAGIPPRDWSAEYLAQYERSAAREAERTRAANAARVAGTRPSLAVEAYAGTYTSDLYGDVRITSEGGRLVLEYAPDYVADLEHWHHDTFRGRWRQRGFGHAFATFSLDRQGRAHRLELEGFGEFRRR
jgi:CubicO group peptidase (beta-lactamase class C family)